MSNLFFVAKKKKSVGKKKSAIKKKPIMKKKSAPKRIYQTPKKVKTASPLILDAKDPFDDISRNAVEDLKMCREDAARSLQRITQLESDLASLREEGEKCLRESSSLRSKSEKCDSDLSKCNSDLSKKIDAFRRMTDKSGVGKSRAEKRAAAKDIEDLYQGIGVDIQEREKRRADRKAAKGSYVPPQLPPSGYKPLPADDFGFDLFEGLNIKQSFKGKKSKKHSAKKGKKHSKHSPKKHSAKKHSKHSPKKHSAKKHKKSVRSKRY